MKTGVMDICIGKELDQGFSNFFPGDPNFIIKIVCDPKRKKCKDFSSSFK